MKTKVVHCRGNTTSSGDYIYIGRPSKWGNPFSHQPNTLARFKVATRADAVAKYEEWIRNQPQLLAAAKAELRGKTLACWCKPLACHGDVLAKISEEE